MTPIRGALYERNLVHHAEVRDLPHVVTNSLPIPYFGDVEAYDASDLRIVTAALNPSREEFPVGGPARFDLKEGLSGQEGLETQLSNYFKHKPYTRWFGNFEHVLNGMGATYGGHMRGRDNRRTALHLDLCSPIATNPTWSKLDAATRESLRGPGRALFELAVQALEPDIIIASVGPKHLTGWRKELAPGPHWEEILGYKVKENGQPFVSPLVVCVTSAAFGTERLIPFANGSASIKPFVNFATSRKRTAGEALLRWLKTNGE
ncbi:hypothetical protein [Rubellimicrobium roseum]|nr:hypothetical protein [Rubellimicrobium roseum]